MKQAVLPYIILATVIVCAGLILSEIWTNVSPLVPHPWEGPTPTPTLWWRSAQPTPPGSPPTATPPAVSMETAEERLAQGADRMDEVSHE